MCGIRIYYPCPGKLCSQKWGKQAVSLDSQIFFSRTIGDVDPLKLQETGRSLNILLVLGTPENGSDSLDLTTEAARLQTIWQEKSFGQVQGDILIQPTSTELSEKLTHNNYQLFFYSGPWGTCCGWWPYFSEGN